MEHWKTSMYRCFLPKDMYLWCLWAEARAADCSESIWMNASPDGCPCEWEEGETDMQATLMKKSLFCDAFCVLLPNYWQHNTRDSSSSITARPLPRFQKARLIATICYDDH